MGGSGVEARSNLGKQESPIIFFSPRWRRFCVSVAGIGDDDKEGRRNLKGRGG